jgi:hypothetical protein
MHQSLDAAVKDAVRRGLPSSWPRLSAELLPTYGTAYLLGGFDALDPSRASDEFNIAVLPEDGRVTDESQEHWTRLRDMVLSRGSTLVTFFATERGRGGFGWEDLVSNILRVEHPQLLTLEATQLPTGTWVVEPAYERVETLTRTVRALWRQHLCFSGPEEGRQRVGVELMADKCWKCAAPLRTVTGIVLPDRLVHNWQGTDWQYFDSLLPLATLGPTTVESICESIALWRVEDSSITPVEMRATHGSGTSYWAATCPKCRAVRGAFYVSEERMRYLQDLESRREGALLYRPLEIDVTFEMLETLSSEGEICPHSRISGWEFADHSDLDEHDEDWMDASSNGAGAELADFLLEHRTPTLDPPSVP